MANGVFVEIDGVVIADELEFEETAMEISTAIALAEQECRCLTYVG